MIQLMQKPNTPTVLVINYKFFSNSSGAGIGQSTTVYSIAIEVECCKLSVLYMRIEIISLNSDSHIFALYPCYYRIKANINAGASYSQRINSHSYFSNLFVQL